MSVVEEEGIVIWKVCRVDSCRNCVFEALNKTRFALPQSKTSERSEVNRPIASRFESFHSCWVERRLYDVKKCYMVSSA